MQIVCRPNCEISLLNECICYKRQAFQIFSQPLERKLLIIYLRYFFTIHHFLVKFHVLKLSFTFVLIYLHVTFLAINYFIEKYKEKK